MTYSISEGDTLKTPTGDMAVEHVDDRRGQVHLSDGRVMPDYHIKQALDAGQIEVVPAGTGGRDTYLRFGDIPDGETSTNNTDGTKEAGVSVYACDEDDGVYHPVGTELQTMFGLLHRPTYLVSGTRVGTGADGEPVIRNVEIETEVTTPKGCGGFVPREDA